MIKKNNIKIIKKLEKDIVKEFVQIFKFKFPKYFKYLIRIPNEGTIYNGSYRYGLRKGVADFLFNYPSKKYEVQYNDNLWRPSSVVTTESYHNLWIEFKRKGNKQTEEQIQFQKDMIEIGSKYIVCYSSDEAIKNIENYLK